MNKNLIYITRSGMVAALYVVLSLISAAFGLSSGVIQVRFSECLCILPMFFPETIPGLFIGCLLTNILTGAVIWDVIFGSLATLIGALGTYYFRKKPFLAFASPLLSNMLIVPLVLVYAYQVEEAYWFVLLTVGAGEFISVMLLGWVFYIGVKKVYPSLKRQEN